VRLLRHRARLAACRACRGDAPPTDAWVAQQLREATPFDQRPRYLIRDNDRKYGPRFARLAAASGIRVLRTPVRAPRANATCERLLGSVRRDTPGQHSRYTYG